MDDQSTPRRSLFAVWHWPRWPWVVVVVLMLVAYPLSIGPAGGLHNCGYFPVEVSELMFIVYTPLFLAGELSPPIATAIGNYVQWWEDRLSSLQTK